MYRISKGTVWNKDRFNHFIIIQILGFDIYIVFVPIIINLVKHKKKKDTRIGTIDVFSDPVPEHTGNSGEQYSFNTLPE